jgi:hypothetical protein
MGQRHRSKRRVIVFDDLDGGDSVNSEQAFDILQELEKSTPDEIRAQRTSFRVMVKAGVTLQSGNSSQLMDFKLQGVTGDISQGGFGALFPLPARVGDVYRLEFEKAKLALPMTFARCMRCVLVREGAYESGFKFFSPIALPQNLAAARGRGAAR